MSVATVVEAVGNPPWTVSGDIGKQLNHLAVAATAVNQSFDGIAPYPAAFAADDAQSAEPGNEDRQK